jgi:hypothetical protein
MNDDLPQLDAWSIFTLWILTNLAKCIKKARIIHLYNARDHISL